MTEKCNVYNHEWRTKTDNVDFCRKCNLKRTHLDKGRSIDVRTVQWIAAKTGKSKVQVFEELYGDL